MKALLSSKGSEKLEKHGKTGMADAPPPWRATARLMAGVLGGPKAASAAGGWFGEEHDNESRQSGFEA